MKGLTVERDAVGEAERGGNAVHVHVVDPRMDVVAAAAQLIERRRLHAKFLGRAPDHGIEADRPLFLALILPEILAVLVDLELGRALQELAGELVVEQIGGLADVIVDADQNHVVHLHRIILLDLKPSGSIVACRSNARGRKTSPSKCSSGRSSPRLKSTTMPTRLAASFLAGWIDSLDGDMRE